MLQNLSSAAVMIGALRVNAQNKVFDYLVFNVFVFVGAGDICHL